MPLTFNLRQVENKDLHLEGELPAEELELDLRDDLVLPAGPMAYDLEVQKLEDAILVQGQARLPLELTCVRCLKKFPHTLELENWACHLPLSGEEAVPVENDSVNLTPQIREDILLVLPQHPLCEPGCGGLKPPAPVMEPGRKSEKTASAWDELDKLKL